MSGNLNIEVVDNYLPLRDVVFQKMRRAILTGELKPGERLMEMRLAEKLGVSRTPVREAIRKLELEGLVVMIPCCGAEVAEITEKSMRDVLEVRRALDVLSVELACERITKEQKQELWQACDAFEKAVKDKNISAVAETDVLFHDLIMKAAGNKRLEQMIHNLSEQMYRYRFEYIKEEKKHAKLVEEHRKICESLANGNHDQAVAMAKLHIDNQEKAIMKQIKKDSKNKI